MCGRYHFGISNSKTGKQLKQKAQKMNLVFAQGEIFPSNNVLCIIPKENKIDLSVKKWGIEAKSLLINARVETLNDRMTFNEIKHRRCALICDGFYEWDKQKNKYLINFNEEYMYLACIFNNDDELVILTKSANTIFSKIHDRMPIIMNKEEMLCYIHNKDTIFKEKELVFTNLAEQTSLFEVK